MQEEKIPLPYHLDMTQPLIQVVTLPFIISGLSTELATLNPMKNHQTQHKNFEQTYHEEMSTEGEEEEFPPLPILGPLLTQESEPSLNEQLFKNTNYKLGGHLGVANTWKWK